jgi:hypothetical protein
MHHRSNQLTNWFRPCALIIAVLLAIAPVSAQTDIEKDNSEALETLRETQGDGPAIFLQLIHETNRAAGAQLFLKGLRLGVSNIVLYYDGEFYLHWTEAERTEALQLIESHFQKLRPRHPFLAEAIRQGQSSQAMESSHDVALKLLEAARESGRIGSPLAMGFALIYKGTPTIDQRVDRGMFCIKLSVIGFKLDKARCSGTYPRKGEGGNELLAFVESYERAIRSGVSEKNWSHYSKYCEFVREEFNRATVCADLVALLDLFCTLQTTDPETASVNGLPMCGRAVEMKVARTVGGMYKEVFDTDVLSLE